MRRPFRFTGTLLHWWHLCALLENGDGMMRNHTAVTWISFCIVLAMVAGLAWLAIHYLERASF